MKNPNEKKKKLNSEKGTPTKAQKTHNIRLITRIKHCKTQQKFLLKPKITDSEKIKEFKSTLSATEKRLPKLSKLPSTLTFISIFLFSITLIILTNIIVKTIEIKILTSLLIFLLMITLMSHIYQKRTSVIDKRKIILLQMVNEWNVDNSGEYCCQYFPQNGGLFNLYKIDEIFLKENIREKSEENFRKFMKKSSEMKEKSRSEIYDEVRKEILNASDIDFLKNLGKMRFSETHLLNNNERLRRLRDLDDELKMELGFKSGINSKNLSFYEPENFSIDSKFQQNNKADRVLIKPLKSNFGGIRNLNSHRNRRSKDVVNESVVDLESSEKGKEEEEVNNLGTTILNKT